MPDDIKPDMSSEEQMMPEGDGAVQNGVAEMPEDVAASEPQREEVVEADPEKAEGDDGAEAPAAESAGEADVNASEGEGEAAMLDEDKQEDAAPAEAGDPDEFPDLSGVRMEAPVASPAEFQQLSPTPTAEEDKSNIDLLLDVKMPVSIELGRTDMPISELLVLGPGSVVELNKLAGEPVDLLVNHRIIAKGEVVVVDENFGVRITQLLSPEERLKSLAQE